MNSEKSTTVETAEAKPDCAPRTCSARPSKCPQCGESIVQTNLGNGQTDDYCEECGWPDENREAYIPPGELKITYAKLQQVIKECCSRIESAPGEPPEGRMETDSFPVSFPRIESAPGEPPEGRMETDSFPVSFPRIESAPGEPPEGYDVDNAELVKVADASWEQGMRQLGTALLNWAFGQPDSLNP